MVNGSCLYASSNGFEQEKTDLETVIYRTNHIKITLSDISQYLIRAEYFLHMRHMICRYKKYSKLFSKETINQ